MASQHHFTDRLRAQLNDTNARNLELQALLAQKDDALAAYNERLQNALAAPSSAGDASILLLQHELRLGRETTDDLKNQLNRAYSLLNQERSESTQHVERLQREVTERNLLLGDASYCLAVKAKDSTAVDGLQTELANVHAELKKTKQYAAGIQKQFEAEKRENTKLRSFPTTAVGKTRTDIDKDDEEVIDE